jgi:membrane associated rhomboid family serine protease
MQVRLQKPEENGPTPHEPVLNVPGVIVAFVLLLTAIHAARVFLMGREEQLWTLVLFSFIPARYGVDSGEYLVPLAHIWTPVTYSLLHGDWTHLAMNCLWLVPFGTPLARRLGVLPLVVFSALIAAAGAALHLAFHAGDQTPMIGASAIASGYMAAVSRFGLRNGGKDDLEYAPLMSLAQCLRNRNFMMFTGLWLVLNAGAAYGLVPLSEAGRDIAWQAHLGGFLCGLILIPLFDTFSAKRRMRRR